MASKEKISTIKDRDRVVNLLKVNLPDPDKDKVLDIVSSSGAVLEGHFAFPDCHSQYLLHFRYIGARMHDECDYLARILVNMASVNLSSETPLKVFSSEVSGSMSLAHSVAKMFVLERQNPFDKIVLAKSGFMDRKPQISAHFTAGRIHPGTRVIVVVDIDRTGLSIDNMIKTVRRCSGTVEAVLAFAVCNAVDHAQRMVDMGVKSHYLAELNIGVSQKRKCSGCDNGLPVSPVSILV